MTIASGVVLDMEVAFAGVAFVLVVAAFAEEATGAGIFEAGCLGRGLAAERWAARASSIERPAIFPPGRMQKSTKWSGFLQFTQTGRGLRRPWAAKAEDACEFCSARRRIRLSS